MTEAVARVVEAGERYLTTRIDLLRVEAGRIAGLSVALFVGATLGLLGWLVLMAAAVLALGSILTPAWSLTIVGGAHFIAGLLVAALGARGLSTRRYQPAAPETATEPAEDRRLRAHVE